MVGYVQDSMSDGRESTSSATMNATDDDQKFLWECCCRIKDNEISARLVLRHLGKYLNLPPAAQNIDML